MRLLERLARLAAGAAAALVLGACHTTPVCTSPPIAISAPIAVTPTLLSPSSGATGVSTGPLDVTIGSAFNAMALFVRDGNGTVTNATNFRPANPPSNDVRIGTFAQLASKTAYTVYAIVPVFGTSSSDPCAPTPAIAPAQTSVLLGTFTTG